MKPSAFIGRLKRGGIGAKRVFAAIGEEGYYRGLAARSVEDYVFKGLGKEAREIAVFEKNLSLERLRDAVNTYPFLAGRSLVVIRDEKFLGGGLFGKKIWEDAKKREKEYNALADILSDAPDYCYALINVAGINRESAFYKRLYGIALICECESRSLTEVGEWLGEEAARRGAALEKEATEFILDCMAPSGKASLEFLSAEMDKLQAYAHPRKIWTRADAEAVFSELPDAAPFILARLMEEGRARDFLRSLSIEKRKGTEIILICGQIIYRLRQLIMRGEAAGGASYGGAHPGSYGYGRKAPRPSGYSLPALKEALLAVSSLSRDIRSGGREFDRLEEIMARLFKGREGRVRP